MVDTELQRQKGIKDSPDLAWQDLLRWGEDPDPYWTRRYVEESSGEVYDWLTGMGVRFTIVIDTPEDTVPRFHFAQGPAINVVLPMMRKALMDPGIAFLWNTRVTGLTKKGRAVTGVKTRNERDGSRGRYTASSIVLATGGFQNNLDMVRANWPAGRSQPKTLKKGAGHYATGDGYRLARSVGAKLQRMDRQVTFFQGIPNPRDETEMTAMFGQNPAAIWVDNAGRRFVNESADSKTVEAAAIQLEPMNFWMVFDSKGARRLNLRGSASFSQKVVRSEIVNNPAITSKANSLGELAVETGLPFHGLQSSVQIWNRMLEVGDDYQFGRFTATERPPGIREISQPPFYALRVYPLTRKSMGGTSISTHGQVLDKKGIPINGLYAAGELTGVAGINGSHGGSGTFLGPSVLTGRIAGKAAAFDSGMLINLRSPATPDAAGETPNYGLPGYWHYDAVHRLASERATTCDSCHSDTAPMTMAYKPAHMLARLRTCKTCH
jgi:predicted oxidoreductase